MLALSLTALMPTLRVGDSADTYETALIRSLNLKWFLSHLKRHLLEKTYILDMYSQTLLKNVKIAYLTRNFFWLSAVSDSADENTFSNIFAKSKPNLKIV